MKSPLIECTFGVIPAASLNPLEFNKTTSKSFVLSVYIIMDEIYARKSRGFWSVYFKHRKYDAEECSHVGFLGKLDFSKLFSLGHHVLILDTHNTTTLESSEVDVIVELGHEVLLESIEISKVFLSDIGEGDAGSGLGTAKLSESSLGFDEAEWDTLLSAESWEEDHDFSWVNIMGHDDELGFTFFDEGGDVVKTVLEDAWLGTVFLVSLLLGLSLESSLLLLLGLWRVLIEELEELRGLVLIDGLLELEQSRWGLESHEEDSLLSLDSDVLWPLDESGKVLLWLDASTNSEGSWGLLEERVGAGS